MKNNKWITGPAVLGLTIAMSGFALQAQPGNPPAGDPPPNQPGGGNRPDFRSMTPEQRQQWMQQARERQVREALTAAGFTDAGLQADIVAFATTQDQATRTLQEQERQIADAARQGNVADAQLATLLANFRTGVAAEKTRRAAAATALDAKIGYSQKPRLDALLMTMGLVGDESSIAGSQGGGRGFGGGGFGGRGGRGGGFGGNNRGGGQGGDGGRA